MVNPQLSIIIPTLNEADHLPVLFADLAAQREVSLEVIVSDGGSEDATGIVATNGLTDGRLSGQVLSGERGRGRQLNLGVQAASSEWLLFLHADSRLADPDQLHHALQHLLEKQQQSNTNVLAGRFALRFSTPLENNSKALFFYETKARLGRPGCIHGDQGFLMSRSFFEQVGPFREDLPVMEDTLLAEKIRSYGQWCLLPGEILTSSRRFESEGIVARQTLNALMMNFLAIGWTGFFARAPDLYRQQDRAQPLQLRPFFRLIDQLLRQMSFEQRFVIWRETGSYVRSQAWQLGLVLDCRKHQPHRFLEGEDPVKGRWLNWFDRWFDPLTDNFVGRSLTALLVRIWFSWKLRRLKE